MIGGIHYNKTILVQKVDLRFISSHMTAFFSNNREIFLFIYGLIFFQLGMAISLQSRSHSRLDLARSLRWLSWFGIIHGLYEWGDIFIPIQATYLGNPFIRLLQVLQVITLGLSFMFLFEFGVALLLPFGRRRWWHGLPLGIFITWMFVMFFLLLPFIPNRETWLNTSNAAARYFIGFPGGLLAAYGLSKQTRLKIALVAEPRFVQVLAVASVALAFYAILAGLFPEPVPFFPGNLINTMNFTHVTGIPPFLLRSFIGLVLTVCIIRGLEVFSLEVDQMIDAMQKQQILAEERQRIGRDLHDGAMQKIYTAGILVESAAQLISTEKQLAPRLERAGDALYDAITDLRHNLVDLRSTPSDTPLAKFLKGIAEDPRFRSLVDVQLFLDLPEHTTLSPLRTDHVIAIVNCALSNTVRHAKARKVKICLSQNGGLLDMTIEDDGVGFPQQLVAGNGLQNMHDRARLLDGKIEFQNKPGKGAIIHLIVPLKEEI